MPLRPLLGEDPTLEVIIHSTIWNKCFHMTRTIWKTLIQDFLRYGFRVLNDQELTMKRLAVDVTDSVTSYAQAVSGDHASVDVVGFDLA